MTEFVSRILVAMISPYSPRKVTGVGTSIIDLCKEFAKNDVDYLLAVPATDDRLPLSDIFENHSNFYEAPNPKIHYLQNLKIVLFNTKLLLKHRSEIDIIQLFTLKSTTTAAAITAKVLNKPVVTSVYFMPPPPLNPVKSIIYKFALALGYNLTDFFAYETGVVRQQCSFRPGSIIPEGIDTGDFKPDRKLRQETRSTLGFGKNEFVMLYAGRLVESKGTMELISALSTLPKSMQDNFKMLIIGNIESASVEKALKKIKKLPWVMTHPPVNRDEIKNYYCAADGFVLPSYYEGISSSLVESMACGLPPIVTRVGGNPEVVHDGKNGLVIEVKDVDGLRDSIVFMVTNDRKRKQMAKAARKTILSRFSIKDKVNAYIELYDKAILEMNGPQG